MFEIEISTCYCSNKWRHVHAGYGVCKWFKPIFAHKFENNETNARPRGYQIFFMLNSTEHKIFPAHNVKMPTIVGILTFMSRKKNSILSLSESEKSWISWYFYTYEHVKFHAQLSWAWKKFYNLGPWFKSIFKHGYGNNGIKEM